MNKITKKLILFLTSFVLIFSIMPQLVFATEEVPDELVRTQRTSMGIRTTTSSDASPNDVELNQEITVQVEWKDSMKVKEPILIKTTNGATIISDSIKFVANGIEKEITGLEIASDRVFFYAESAGSPASFLNVLTYKITAAPQADTQFKVSTKIGLESLPNNILTNYSEKTYKTQNIPTETGKLTGVVKDGQYNIVIPNARIQAFKSSNETLVNQQTTSTNGTYEITLPVDQYKVDISADGYRSFSSYIPVNANETVYMETFLMVTDEEGEGTSKVNIADATNNVPVEGTKLEVRNDWNNTSVGPIVGTYYTDSSGDYNITLPYGNYTVNVSKDGFITDKFNIIIVPIEMTYNFFISPKLSDDANSYRIVLRWGDNPRDLDSHLRSDSGAHVFYSSKISAYANLDIDVITGRGPETVTITNFPALGAFKYSVHDYTNRNSSGLTAMSLSGANVTVYKGDSATPIKIYNIPYDRSGTVWDVFQIDANGVITDLNTFRNVSSPIAVRAPIDGYDDWYSDDFLPSKD